MFRAIIDLPVLLFSLIVLAFAKCPDGSVEWQSSCYVFQSNPATFTNAEFACNNINGHLVSVHDGFTNALLAAQSILYFNQSSDNDFWIGLNTLIIPGNWSWMDKTGFDFKDWAPSEPQNLSMNCAAVTIQNGYWISDDCFKLKAYVCEVPQIFQMTTTTVSYPVNMNCSQGWVYFEPTHSCYGKNDIDRYSYIWTDAEQYCEKQNAHLPSLHNFEETKFLSFISQHTPYVIWTGLYSNDNEITWKWSDESPVDYLPWASGYPKLNISSCAYLGNEQIVDYNCTTNFVFICKKPALI